MRNHFSIYLLLAFFALCLSSCYERIGQYDSENSEVKPILTENGRIILGERLSNPYSLRNMQKALDTLLATKGLEP